ncbi:MAG: hypothetical protein E7378_04435 [Clostridiales bacterium]|nr:hypothetical protein [Clostridiales bacterium]
MTKKVKITKKLLCAVFSIMALCLCFSFGVFLNVKPAFAASTAVSGLTNLDFAYNGNSSSLYQNPTGWTKGPDNNATSGTINLNDYENESFNLSVDQVPKKIEGLDDYVLMINSKNDKDTLPKSQYYKRSSDISLSAYSSYKIKVYTKVLSGANASIYVTGLDQEVAFEQIDYQDAREWTDYTFYISTGYKAQSVNLELWLGSKPANTSTGAVFFDNVEVSQISQNEISDVPSDPVDAQNARFKVVDLDESTLVEGINANFETNSLADWTRINELKVGSYAKILNLNALEIAQHEGISKYEGFNKSNNTDLSKNNTSAFVMYTLDDATGAIGYKSKDLTLAMHDIVKISANAKVSSPLSGNAFFKFVEKDVKDFNDQTIKAIAPVSKEISISSNKSNALTNNYTTYTFYVKGRNLYPTTYNLELWLGSTSAEASGVVAFDNIRIENVSYNDYTSASTSDAVVKVELETSPNSYTITNSAFNDVKKLEKDLTYPLDPIGWAHTASDADDVYYGVVNTNSTVYDANKNQFGNFANPGNPQGFGSTLTDTNNILLMHNFNEAYQSVTSSSFKVSENSYYKLSFAYNFGISTDNFNVSISDDANNIIYSNTLDKDDELMHQKWLTYTVYINTKSYSNTLSLTLSLGNEADPVSALVYIDNVILTKEELSEQAYAEIAEHNNVLDFQEGNFNLVDDGKDGLFTALRYTGNLDAGQQSGGNALDVAFGGIIDGKDEEDAYNVTNSTTENRALTYMMMIQTMDQATYSLTAKDGLSLSADSYYKFTIDIQTQGINAPEQNQNNKFGAVFALKGLEEKWEGIVSNQEWKTYTIYVATTEAKTINLQFALVSLDQSSSGIAFFDNYTFTKIEKEEYLDQLNNKDNAYNLFIGNTDTKEDDSDNTTSTANMNYLWVAIPSILLVVALILALVAHFMKKVKIKKWEKRKINDYDRENVVARDMIRMEAETQRNNEIATLNERIKEMKAELEHIDEVHKEQVKATRTNRAQGVSKSTEREFKQYAKLRTAIENRIISYEKEIASMNTAEYLLSIQHKLMIEKAKKERIAKEEAYKKDKLNKKTQAGKKASSKAKRK